MPGVARSSDSIRPGSIKRVELINFMCHAELAVDFGTQVSFVTGHNGSGKSAILAGIVAGLGARANVTSRGGKLSDLIKHGERSAKVTIHLHNGGSDPEPFLPNVYGSTIHVERTFHMDKAGSYTLKSASGKVVSKKRVDLDLILSHFDIQVNNPVFLMNQDTCRSFLNSKTPKDLYSFFYKAPLLDEMEEASKTAHKQSEESRVVVQQKQEEMDPINASIESWRAKQAKCVRPESIQKDIDNIKMDIRIKECHGQKVALDAAKTAASDAETQLAVQKQRSVKNEDEKTKEQELCKAMEVSQKALDESKPGMIRIRDEAQSAQRKIADCKAELSDKSRNLRSLETQLEAARNQQELQEFDQKRVELEAQVEESRTLIQECRINRGASENNKKRLDEELQDCKRHLEPVNIDFQSVKRAIEDIDRDLRQFEGSQGSGSSSATSRLGQDAVAKKQIIDNLVQRKALRGQILGPCVELLSLKDQVYGTAVERAVGGWFRTYLLEDERDRQVIMEEFKRRNVSPPTLDCALGTGQKFPTMEMAFNDKCNGPFPTVADLLTFKHPYVRNVLVDACNLHQVIVMPTMEQARRHYRDEQPYQNCRHILDMAANQHSKDADGYQFIPGRGGTVRILAANFDAQIMEKKRDRSDKAAVCDSKKVEKMNLESRGSALQKQLQDITREITRLQDLEVKTQNKLNNIMNELESIKTSQPTDIQVLLDEVAEVKAVIEQLTEQHAELQAIHLKAKKKETKAEQNFTAMKEQASDEVKQQTQFLEDIEKLEKAIEKNEADVLGSKKVISTHEKSVEAKKADVERLKAVLDASKVAILEAGIKMERLQKRIKPTRDEMDQMIDQLEIRLRDINADYENSWEFCQQKLDELLESKVSIEAQLKSANRVVELMGKNARQRAENFVTSREKSSAILCGVFSELMEERGYEGKIVLDHDIRILEFDINPHPGTQQQELLSVKSLSGGERSFSMVCFLVSLWALIEIPFRVLDEFDVFMDMINRDFAMHRLIKSAVESGRQFIFLTPLHFSQSILDDFKISSSVEVVRMPTSREKAPPDAAAF